MAITEDASTPAIVQNTGAGTSTTASFSPPANSLLVALVNGGWSSSGTTGGPTTASVSDSVGGTWTAAVTATGTNTSAYGVAKIFYRYLSSAPGSMTVSATFTNLNGGRQLAVRVLNGAASNQTGAGTGTTVNAAGGGTTSGTVSVTTTVTGSQVYGASDNCGNASALTPNGVTSILSGGNFNNTTDTVRLVAWTATSTTGTPGATTFGGTWATACQSNIAALEILPVTTTTFPVTATLAAVSTLTATLSLPPKATLAAVSTLTATTTPPVIPAFPTIPRDTAVELFLNNTWLDVTADVRASTGIDITRGRPNEASSPQPSTCALTFDNRSGNYSPRNPVGAYYGQIGRNTPIRVAVGLVTDTFTRTVVNGWGLTDTGHAWGANSSGTFTASDFQVNGGVGKQSVSAAGGFRNNYITTPLWRDIDVSVTVTLPFTTVTGDSVYPANILLRWWTAAEFYLVSPEITTAGHVMLRIRRVLASGTTQLTSVDTGIIHSSSQALRVRAQIEGQTIRGKVWPAAGNEPYRWNTTANDAVIPFAGQVAVQSQTNAPNTNTYPVVFSYDNVKVRSPRFFGEVASWPQRWDTAGIDTIAPIEAAGVTRRLGQGQSPVTSTLFLGETMQSPAPKAYWPCEDGTDSAYIISGVGGPNMYLNTIVSAAASNSATPTTKFASFTGFVASAPLPVVGANTTWSGVIPTYTATNSATISFITNISGTAIVDSGIIATLKMAGTGTSWQIRYRTLPGPPVIVGDLSVTVLNASGTNIHDSGPIAFSISDQNILIKLSVTQNGTGVDYNIATLQVGQDVAQFIAHTVASTTVTRATQVIIAEAGELPNTPIGHVGVVDYVGSAFDLATQLKAYSGETALARITRLCNQISVPLTYHGDHSGNALTNTTLVGAQHVDTALNIISEAANTDLGTLTEPRGDAGLLYRTRASVYAQPVAVVLDYAGGHISPPFEPLDDDQLTRNDVTVTRRDGTSATAMLLLGRMSVLDPSQGGVGIYDTGTTVNVAADAQLPNVAGWLLNVGTVDQTRYPKVRVDLANPRISSNAALSAAVLDLTVDDYFLIVNPKTGQTPDAIAQIARGYSEHIAPFEHSIVINAAPEAPYDTARADVAGVKADTSGSTLAAGVTATATTLAVSTAGALWTTVAGHMPIAIKVGGERMTVTAVSGSSSPQTFTVTRSVNGVVKAQTAGAAVALFFPSPVPL